MEIYYNLEKPETDTAVALGFFDGVHIAHQRIIEKTVKCAELGLKPCVLTFLQNPKSIVKNIKLDLITTNEKKLEIIKNIGIQAIYMLDFNSVRDMLPEDFIINIIHNALNAKVVFCGFNYRFGKFGKGNADTLRNICQNFNIEVFVESPVLYADQPISSTRIRSALREKNFELANRMLIRK